MSVALAAMAGGVPAHSALILTRFIDMRGGVDAAA